MALPSVDEHARPGALDIELDERIATVVAQPSVEIEQRREKNPRWANIQFASLCLAVFLGGWNDGSTGPLLPRIQTVYHVGYTIVSIVFVLNSIGFVAGSISNIYLTDKLGFGKVVVLGSVAPLIGYCLQAPAPPFPLFCLSFCFNGFGLALQDAQASGYVASYKENAASRMGLLHAFYGAGAFAAPLVATQFSHMHRWSLYYLVSLGVALLNTASLVAVFRFKTQDECLDQIGQAREDADTSHDAQGGKYGQIFRLKALHLLAFFILVYVGIGGAIGGWIVTFIVEVRGGGSSSGYVSAGFFGGLTLGRVALLWVNKKVGERHAIFLYILLAIGLELVVWLVPSLIGSAVAVSLIGFLFGPIYPIVMNEAGRVLPRWLLTGCIGWIAGFGQTGSAVLPFLTGAIASKTGIKSLQPL
ncbi:MFS general substrate transporter [Artomyces pyxidatus]|uniref:MFS general substrate transporter n=1 Tax=Artomyces pyxidatus TaxID=48021 RepID=A0ACB8TBG7_9AGAM|nr:MFS general substrate transporter [Artomyces pyxidatus]